METTNLTVSLPAATLRQAKAIAALRGDSLSGIVRARLEEYVKEFRTQTPHEDDADWRRLGIEQFFAGYSESDAIYDAL